MPTDVLIIGAGPVGLTFAAELARFGLSLRIVDTAPQPTGKSKALVVWPRTLELLQRLNLADAFLAAGRQATHARFFQAGKELALIHLDSIQTPFPFALMVPQSETERLLTEHLNTLGISVERPVTFTSATQSDNSVTTTLTHADGQTETVTSRWLIAADGAHSAVRHSLNAAFEGETLPSDWVLADLHLTGPIDPAAVELHLHADGVLGLFPIPPDRFRVIANTSLNSVISTEAQRSGETRSSATDPGAPSFVASSQRVGSGTTPTGNPQPPPDPTLADIQSILDTRDHRGLQASHPIWLSAFHINERRVASFRHGSIFLAGDAAHIHSPAGGQGMNTGMQDAFNLAWKLALLQKNLVSPLSTDLLLDSYHAERSPIAAQVLKASGFLTRLATLDNALLRTLRNQIIHLLFGFDTVQHAFAENASELAIHYPETPLNAQSKAPYATPKPGDRAPVRPGDLPIGAGPTPRFALFAAPGPDADQFIACFPTLLEPQPRPPFIPSGLHLVRPDGYVAFAADVNAYPRADAYMVNLIYGPQQKVTLPT